MKLNEVFELIRAERHEQIRKWGFQVKTREQWLSVLVEEFLEVTRAVNDSEPEEKYRNELVQLAAVCCQILEG